MKNIFIISIVGIVAISSAMVVKNTSDKMEQNKELQQIAEMVNNASVDEIILKSEKIYLPIDGEERLQYDIKTTGEIELNVSYEIENEGICSIDENGIVHGLSKGTSNIIIHVNDKSVSAKVEVTDLIIPVPDEPNSEKELINGKTYTKEENDLLDEILNDRINKAGYKTRAGVVAAARFIGLEFPYRIPYFSENGRLNHYGITTYCDGEGRYYHRGLFLNSSRFSVLEKSLYGPATWGTYIYSIPSQGRRANGFDCSGFISWIVYNGGFEPGDVGAGVSDVHDMTDLGEKKVLTTSIDNNELKVGDLLSGKGSDGGHIALIAGITDEKYYVAESLWAGTGYFGAIIRTYEHDRLKNNFYWHIDMDEFYGQDGNCTAYWK